MRKEIVRQAIHFFSGAGILLLILFFGTQFALPIAVIALILGFALSRQMLKKANHPLKEIICLVEREEECNFPGKAAFMLFAGIALTLLLFQQKTIVLAAVIALTYGDSASTIIGKKFGKTKTIGERTVSGSVAGMIATFIMLALFINIGIALLAAMAAMLAEYLPTDDNISMPLVTATVLSFII